MTKEITDEMFYLLCDYRMSEPIPLKDADLTSPFIYDRDYGVFYVDGGYHQLGMALLFAWRHGALSVRQLLKENSDIKKRVSERSHSSSGKYEYLSECFLLDLKGTAMGSSVASHLQVGRIRNLNEEEKQIIGRYEIQELAYILGL